MSAFDRVIGYKDEKAELMRICDVLKNPKKYKKLGVTIPRGILLDGEPGIGKTMMAMSFIEECGCKSFMLRKNNTDWRFISEIKDVFAKANKEDSAIVFLDDLDKFANEDEIHPNAPEYVTVQSCIDDSKDNNVFVIATTNGQRCLPVSLLRAGRIDKVIEMSAPRGKDAARIIEYYISKKQVVGNIDIEEIARLVEGYTCAEMESTINEAGIYAAYEGRTRISRDDLIRACMRLLFDAPESIEVTEKSYFKKIAIHEAGHAVVSEILEPGSVSVVSVQCHNWFTGGITKFKKQEEIDVSKKLQENDIIRTLGGRAATAIILGEDDMGCQRDVDDAFYQVERLIDTLSTCGFKYYLRGEPTECRKSEMEKMVTSEMERYYKEAERIVAKYRVFVIMLANDRLKKKYLTYKDIKDLRMRYEKYNGLANAV